MGQAWARRPLPLGSPADSRRRKYQSSVSGTPSQRPVRAAQPFRRNLETSSTFRGVREVIGVPELARGAAGAPNLHDGSTDLFRFQNFAQQCWKHMTARKVE
jgi:hypothetical protein